MFQDLSLAQRFPNALLQPHKYFRPDRKSRLQLVDMMRLISGEYCGHQSRTQRSAGYAERTLLKRMAFAKTSRSGTTLCLGHKERTKVRQCLNM